MITDHTFKTEPNPNDSLTNSLREINNILISLGVLQKNRIKALMTIKGITGVELTRTGGFDAGDLSKVVSGVRKSEAIQTVIAGALGLEIGEVFNG